MIERIQNSNYKWVCVDFETQNLNLAIGNRPWEIGLLVCEGQQIIEQHSHYILWKDLKISDDAKRITRFDEKDYKAKAVQNVELLDLLENYLYNEEYLIVYHNGLNFENFIHNMWRKELGRKTDYSYINRCLDTHSLAKGLRLEIPYRKSDSFLAYQYQMNSVVRKNLKTSLSNLAKEYKIDWNLENLHRAIEDVKLNKVIWERVIKPKLENWLLLA